MPTAPTTTASSDQNPLKSPTRTRDEALLFTWSLLGGFVMKASDVMVTDVITVKPESNVPDVAELLLTNRISAVPVIDDAGNLVGIVSEGDLLRRCEADTGHERAWWLRLLMGRENLAAEYLREHSRRVADIMTREVISAEPDTPV